MVIIFYLKEITGVLFQEPDQKIGKIKPLTKLNDLMEIGEQTV